MPFQKTILCKNPWNSTLYFKQGYELNACWYPINLQWIIFTHHRFLMMTPARSPSGTKYGKLTTFKETFAFCPWQGLNHDQGGKNAGQSLEYKLFTKCPHPTYVTTQFIKVFCPLARIWVAEKRIENGGRTFDKSWNVNYSFQACWKYQGRNRFHSRRSIILYWSYY